MSIVFPSIVKQNFIHPHSFSCKRHYVDRVGEPSVRSLLLDLREFCALQGNIKHKALGAEHKCYDRVL
jgi:hypothetical protein